MEKAKLDIQNFLKQNAWGIITAAFLAEQHPECEVTEVTFQEVEPVLKECRMFHDINTIVQKMISERYSIPDEIKMVKLPVDDPARVEYQEYVDACRAYGRAMKIERGLRLV